MSNMSRNKNAFCWDFFFSGYWWLWHLEIQLWATSFVEKISVLTPLIILISKQSYEQKKRWEPIQQIFFLSHGCSYQYSSLHHGWGWRMFWLAYKPRAFRICGGDTLATHQLRGLNFACLLRGMMPVSPACRWWWKTVQRANFVMSTDFAGNSPVMESPQIGICWK